MHSLAYSERERRTELEGKLELARIERPGRKNRVSFGKVISANPHSKSLSIQIANGKRFVGNQCLVRFDGIIDVRYELPRASFITSQIPEGFQEQYPKGINRDAFVLYGNWEPCWKMDKYNPLISINRHYDPGKMGKVIYFPQDFERNGALAVFPHEISRTGYTDVCSAVRNDLLKQRQNSRVIIFESIEEMQRAVEEIKTLDLVPIKMEDLAIK